MLEEKLREYIGAKVPIIYVSSFDDNAVERIIFKVTGRRKVWEWNRMWGCINRKEVNKQGVSQVRDIVNGEWDLEQFLTEGVKEKEFNRKVILIKDAAYHLENPDIVALLKNACLWIEEGELDTVFVFISSILKVPKELEKYMTILQEEYLTEDFIYWRL